MQEKLIVFPFPHFCSSFNPQIVNHGLIGNLGLVVFSPQLCTSGLRSSLIHHTLIKLREKKGASKKSKNGVIVVADTGSKVGKRQMDDGNVNGNGITVKKFKAADKVPVNATKEVYASLFTSSKKKSDFRETYSCRSLPLGRN